VAVGNVVVTSRDGVNWVQRQNLNFPFNSICYAAGQFVAVGDSGSFFTSLDGIEWQQRSSGTTRNLSDVTYGDGHFLVVGEDGTILQSESIITLSATAQPNDGLVTISLTGPAVLTYTVQTSTDLMNWGSLTNVTKRLPGPLTFDTPSSASPAIFYRAFSQ